MRVNGGQFVVADEALPGKAVPVDTPTCSTSACRSLQRRRSSSTVFDEEGEEGHDFSVDALSETEAFEWGFLTGGAVVDLSFNEDQRGAFFWVGGASGMTVAGEVSCDASEDDGHYSEEAKLFSISLDKVVANCLFDDQVKCRDVCQEVLS